MGVYLPRWVWIGAALLACVSGMVNVVGYLSFEHQAVSNMTGATTLLGGAIAQGDRHGMLHLAGVMLAFVLGATVSGIIVQDSTLRLGRRYGVALATVSLLLYAAIPLFQRQSMAGALLAAMACGLQNAMATTFSGAVIRTSHLSGMFTDLGIALGHALRGMPLQKRRLLLCGLVITAFFCGAVLGGLLFSALGYWALAIPASATGLTGVGYISWQFVQRRRRAD